MRSPLPTVPAAAAAHLQPSGKGAQPRHAAPTPEVAAAYASVDARTAVQYSEASGAPSTYASVDTATGTVSDDGYENPAGHVGDRAGDGYSEAVAWPAVNYASIDDALPPRPNARGGAVANHNDAAASSRQMSDASINDALPPLPGARGGGGGKDVAA